jgi:hypothetical protein
MLVREGFGQLLMRASLKQRPYGFDGFETHPRRRARREDAIDQLFPEQRIRSLFPDVSKLREACANLTPSRMVCCTYVFNCDDLVVWSHEVFSRKVLSKDCMRQLPGLSTQLPETEFVTKSEHPFERDAASNVSIDSSLVFALLA